MMAGIVVGLGFEIISKLDSYFLMTVHCKNSRFQITLRKRFIPKCCQVMMDYRVPANFMSYIATQWALACARFSVLSQEKNAAAWNGYRY